MDTVSLGQISQHKSQNGHSFVFNADIGLRNWRAFIAKLNAGANIIGNLNIVGDSITEGCSSGGGAISGAHDSFPANGFVGRLRAALYAKYGDLGTGMGPTFYPTGAETPLWVFSGSWVDNTSYGVGMLSKKSTVNGDTATYTFTGTGVAIIAAKTSTGATFSASVDGGAASNFNTNNVSTVYASVFSITGLSSGTHTLTITNTGTGGNINLNLIGAYATTALPKGVRVNMCGKYGAASWNDSQLASLFAEIDIWSPILTIIALGANDYSSNVPPSTYKSYMQTIISRALTYGDCLLLSTGIRGDNPSPTYPQTAYNQVQYDLAIKNNCAFMDLFNRWSGNFALVNTTYGFIADGAVHPNDYGHQDIATFVLNTLLENRS